MATFLVNFLVNRYKMLTFARCSGHVKWCFQWFTILPIMQMGKGRPRRLSHLLQVPGLEITPLFCLVATQRFCGLTHLMQVLGNICFCSYQVRMRACVSEW